MGTAEELDRVLASDELNTEGSLRVVELTLGKLDAPATVRNVAGAVEEFNRKKAVMGA